MSDKTGIQLMIVETGRRYGEAYFRGLAMEECGELIQVLNKLNRLEGGEYGGMEAELKDRLFEEIADVEVVLQVLKNKYRCENDVYEWKRRKLERQAERNREA